MRLMVDEVRALEDRLREGGGEGRIERQHAQGKLTARERIDLLIDPGGGFLEIGLLIAYDQYDGKAPGVGVVTGIGEVGGRPVVIVANDATVKAGSWWPETIPKKLRAQEIADAIMGALQIDGRGFIPEFAVFATNPFET